jgi:hypothetical protein
VSCCCGRRHTDIPQAGLIGLLVVLAIYVTSVLLPPHLGFLPRRMNGLVQLSYSLIIGYALFATIIKGTRAQIAGLFLACSLVLLVGCLLETYGGLRPVSDAARRILYHRGFYEADLPRLAVLRVDPPEILRVRTIQRHLLLHALHFPLAGCQLVALAKPVGHVLFQARQRVLLPERRRSQIGSELGKTLEMKLVDHLRGDLPGLKDIAFVLNALGVGADVGDHRLDIGYPGALHAHQHPRLSGIERR